MSTSGESKSKSAKAEGVSLPDSEGPNPVPVDQTEEPEKAGKSQNEDPSPLDHVKSELSKPESLNMKLELLRSNTDLSADDKLQLLNDRLTLGDWNKLNGRFSSARKKTVKLRSWLQAKGRKLTGTWLAALPLTQP